MAQTADLLPVRGQVEQHGVALVVEPDGRQVGVLIAPHDGDDGGNRLVEQPLEAGVQIGKARHGLTFADRELAWLGALWARKWWSTVYVDQADLAGVQAAVATADLTRVQYWLADWSLNEAEAEARLQPNLDGGIVAVQWASPSSNPRTLVPGSSLTLAEANVDLSVTVYGWYRP